MLAQSFQNNLPVQVRLQELALSLYVLRFQAFCIHLPLAVKYLNFLIAQDYFISQTFGMCLNLMHKAHNLGK